MNWTPGVALGMLSHLGQGLADHVACACTLSFSLWQGTEAFFDELALGTVPVVHIVAKLVPAWHQTDPVRGDSRLSSHTSLNWFHGQ